jgi:hypothetical protein
MNKGANMKTSHSIAIGFSIVIGFVLHGAIKAWPEYARNQRGYDLQIRMMEMTPREMSMGDTTVLYMPRISYSEFTIDVDYEFYRYDGTELKQVKLTK